MENITTEYRDLSGDKKMGFKNLWPCIKFSVILHLVILLIVFFSGGLSSKKSDEINTNVVTKQKNIIQKPIQAHLWTKPIPVPPVKQQKDDIITPVIKNESIERKTKINNKINNKITPKKTVDDVKYNNSKKRKSSISNLDRKLKEAFDEINGAQKPLKDADVSGIIESINEKQYQEIVKIDKSFKDKKGKELDFNREKYIDELNHPLRVVEEKDEFLDFVMDPVLEYQQKIAKELQDNIRVSDNILGKTSILGVELSRDGLILNIYCVQGSEDLCEQAIIAAERIGKISMPDDDEIFNYLRELRITVITEKQ